MSRYSTLPVVPQRRTSYPKETKTVHQQDSHHSGQPDGVMAQPMIPRPANDNPDGGSHVQELLCRLNALEPHSAVWNDVREELVRLNMPLVSFLVRRFIGRGEPWDDLMQVATIGLIKAIDRFDPDRGVEFSTYATPTVVGEVKRHFRDRGWALRVPRRLQENALAVSKATSELFNQLSRAPRVDELCNATGLGEEDVVEAISSVQAYTTVSLDAQLTSEVGSLLIQPPSEEAIVALEGVENRAALRPLLNQLSARERQVIVLRFFANMTQSEIAAEIGVSQMHVSRLLSRSLTRLRGCVAT